MTSKHYLWISLYILVGIIFMTIRLWNPNKYKKLMEVCHDKVPEHYLQIVFPITMVLMTLMWPLPFFSFIKRKIKGEENEFDKIK